MAVNNALNTGAAIVLGGSFTMSGGFTFTGTVTGNTAVTFPTSGTLISNDSPSAGNVGTFMRSNGSAWAASVPTIPNTFGINTVVYASAANVLAAIAAGTSSVLVTSGTDIPSFSTDLPTAITIGGAYIYRVGGTDVSLADGGTNASLVADNGAIVYSTATAMGLLAATATAGQIIRSGSNAAPTWSTATYPATAGTSTNVLTSDGTNWNSTAIAGLGSPLTTKGDLYTYTTVNARLAVGATNGQILQVSSGAATGLAWSTPTYPSASGTAGFILRSDGTNNVYSQATYPDIVAINSILFGTAANTVGPITPAVSSVLISSAASTGVPAWSGALANGEIIIGSTGATPVVASITAGTGITITPGAGTITIDSSGGGFTVATIAGTTQSAAIGTMYIALNAGQTTVTLPAVCAVGDMIRLVGSAANTGGWILDAPVGDTIMYLGTATSSGGTITSTAAAGEAIEVVCDVADTSWIVVNTASVTLTTA